MAQNRLHPGARWLFRINSFFGWLIFMFFMSIWLGSFLATFVKSGTDLLAGIIVFFILFIIALIILVEIYARLAYHFWLYEFTDSQLRIEKGIIWKRYSNIPYERIQNVDITRGIIARLCGFSTVNIQTAGYSMPSRSGYGMHSEGYIPAVSMEDAEAIREFVIKKITKKGRKQGL